jgi:hypothetical protein
MFFQAGNQRKIIPSWFWILLAVPIAALIRWLICWFFYPSYKRTSALEINDHKFDTIPVPRKKDDFSILKGIGPKTAEMLHKAGVFSFEQLGLMDPKQLDLVLRKYSLPTTKADFWQKQAALAAAQDWEALKKLQK